MPVDLYEKVDRAAGTGGGRSRLGVTVWQLVAFVGVSLAAAAYLCGECCGKAARARSATHLTLVGHDGAVRTVLFGRDGSMLSSVGANGTIAVWDLDGGWGIRCRRRGPGRGAARPSAPTGGCWRRAGPTGRSRCTTLRRASAPALRSRRGHRRRPMPGLRAGRPYPGRGPSRRADHALGGRHAARATVVDDGAARSCRGSQFAGVFARRGNPGLLRRRPSGAAVGRGDRPAAAGDRRPARHVRGAGVHAR